MWFVGATETMSAEWQDADSGSPLSASSVGIEVTRWNGATLEYLQADETTFSATPHAFTATAAADVWSYTITVPAAAEGYNVVWEAVPVPADYGRLGQVHYVGPDVGWSDSDHVHLDTEIVWTTTEDALTSPVTTSHRHLAGTDATNELFVQQYKRDPGESFRAFTDVGGTDTGYVRGASGGNNLHVNGAKEAGVDVTVTWRGSTYTITGNPSNFPGTTVGGTTWEFNGDPGAETAPGTPEVFQIEQVGNLTQTVDVVVDRTAPTIATWQVGDFAAGKGTGTHHGAATGDRMYRGEYVRFDYNTSDANSGIDTRTVSEPGGDVIGSVTVGAGSGTTSFTRTVSGLPTTATTKDVRLTVTDLAGNVATSDVTLYFAALPTQPTINSTVVTSPNESPHTVHTTNFTETDYDDDTVSATVGWTPATVECRNSGNDDTRVRLLSGTLALSTATTNDVDGQTSQALNAEVATDSTGLGLTITADLSDQHYRTDTSAGFGDFDYNANKATDLGSDLTVLSFGDLGLNNSGVETFHDAETQPRTSPSAAFSGGGIVSTSNVTISGGFADGTATNATVAVKVPIAANNASNDQYAIRLQGPSGQVTESDGLSVEWAETGTGSWNSTTTGTLFTGPTGAAFLDVRVTWSAASDPNVGVVAVGFVE